MPQQRVNGQIDGEITPHQMSAPAQSAQPTTAQTQTDILTDHGGSTTCHIKK